MRAGVPVGGEEAEHLGQHVLEVPGLASVVGREGVAVHRIADPHHGVAGVADRIQQGRKEVHDLRGTHSGDEREPAGLAVRVEGLAEGQDLVGGRRRSDLASQWVADPSEELNVGSVQLAGALADPEHVGRAVVPVAGERVRTRESLLVIQ